MKIPENKNFLYKYKFIGIISLLVFTGLAIILCAHLIKGIFNYDEGRSVTEVFHVEKTDFSIETNAYGILRASTRRALIAEVEGAISEVYLQPGDIVEPSTIVVKLSSPNAQRDFSQALLNLDEHTYHFEELKAELLNENLIISNELEVARSILSNQESEYEANSSLVESGIISLLDFQKVTSELNHARLNVKLLENRLDALNTMHQARLRSAQLRIDRARTELEIKQFDLESLSVKSGIHGVIQNLDDDFEVGKWLNRGQPFGVISDMSSVYAELQVPSYNAMRISIGDRANVTVNQSEYVGKVRRIAPSANRNQVQIEVEFLDVDLIGARPELEVTAVIHSNIHEKALTIARPKHYKEPDRLIRIYKESNIEDTFTAVELEVIEYSRTHIVVSGEIQENDRILLKEPESVTLDGKIIL